MSNWIENRMTLMRRLRHKAERQERSSLRWLAFSYVVMTVLWAMWTDRPTPVGFAVACLWSIAVVSHGALAAYAQNDKHRYEAEHAHLVEEAAAARARRALMNRINNTGVWMA